MPQSENVSFVTWPNGQIDQNSLTVAGETMAKRQFLNYFLPEQWFGEADKVMGWTAIDGLWRAAQSKGFRIYTIRVKDGQPEIVT